ncbi:SMP-30/gluconolactonase/LRE family protein [Acidisoma cellulosilytica]|uniref:SMP-30/gluconolactonase/LRE family protein n=1 Tax=Acidisoma cellulosilyticum TaxID=2802395 RepID=A0A963Z491_9PROT|nr:SMP-30/gluconolactonase/LRE family protein [Acidisoma cellulosilyticum]MCB8882595.1 SMP-30/gluconolactonase/LRE family protein [Acidisoma cellulosilyticum]
MTVFDVLADGLAFPEGPVVLPDGSLVVVEIGRGQITHIGPRGKQILAKPGGGPNGAALGPDGLLYVCNNGGFSWHSVDGTQRPVAKAIDNTGGRIERIDLASGIVEVLYDRCGDRLLSAPNDIVFDRHGGFWFTDHGHRSARQVEFGSVYYARSDGSSIVEAAFPLVGPNGIGLSPDGDILYVAETSSGRLWSYPVLTPGELGLASWPSPTGGDLVCGLPGFHRYDSLAVEAEGNVVIASLRFGGFDVVSPAGTMVERIDMPDPYTTNICFGGAAMQTAYVTLSSSGRVVSMPWARPGLRLNHQS